MRKASVFVGAAALPVLLLAGAAAIALQKADPSSAPARPPTTRPAALDIGSPAPPIRAATWLGGEALAVHQHGKQPVFVVTFWASWSEPSRAALADLVKLHQRYRARNVGFVAVSAESAQDVRSFLAGFHPVVPFPIAIDQERATTRAYCEAAGVGFLPYAFVLGPNRTVAWHGHPQQAELAAIVEQLLSGRYDRAQARKLVRQSRSVEQLEALFREAYANEAWHTALLTLEALLETEVPEQRLLRYKLTLLLGELDESEPAAALADELMRRYADDAGLLNSAAWDVVSQPRLYERDPEIGLKLARAAYRAGGGRSPAIADTYARALYTIGRVDLAIQVQTRAVQLVAPQRRADYERTLTFYQRCQALHAGATADPN